MQNNDLSWSRRTRFSGALCYHAQWMLRPLLTVLAILAGSQLLAMVMAALEVASFEVYGLNGDFGTALLVAFVGALLLAHSRTRFLSRIGTGRFPIWLSNIVALIVGVAAFLVATIALVFVTNLVALLMRALVHSADIAPVLPTEIGRHLLAALRELPYQLLWLTEWSCIFYLIACCLRWHKGLTLAVLIGVPMAFMVLMLVPAVNETVAAVENASEGEIMMMGLQWWMWLERVTTFVVEQWRWIQLSAALVSLPLSYLAMRATPQP